MLNIVSVATHTPRLPFLNQWLDLNIPVFMSKGYDLLIVNMSEDDYNLYMSKFNQGFSNPKVSFFSCPENLHSHNKYYWTFLNYPNDNVLIVDDDMDYHSMPDYNFNSKLPQTNNASDRFITDYNIHKLFPDFCYSLDLFAHGSASVFYPAFNRSVPDIALIREYIMDDDSILHLSRIQNTIPLVNLPSPKMTRVPWYFNYEDSSLTALMPQWWSKYGRNLINKIQSYYMNLKHNALYQGYISDVKHDFSYIK